MKTIGKLAKALAINVETIRYYERKDLIKQPIKPLSGYRVYDEMLIKQLKFILKAKSLGFTLIEIKSLMSLSHDCKKVESLSLHKLTLINNKIADLTKLAIVIETMTNSCQSTSQNETCPIITALNS